MKIIVENCVFMNGGDSAIGFACKRIVEDAFPDAEIVFADSGVPAIAALYPDIDFVPLPSFVLGETPAMRLAKRRFGPYRKYFVIRRAGMAWAVFLARLGHRLGFAPRSDLGRAIAPYLDADLVITTGGTYLLSKYDFTPRILEFQKDFHLGKPVIAFTQSLEPFAEDYRTRAVARYLSKMALILVRHATSRDHVAAVAGGAAHVRVAADCVFALWQPGPTTVADRRARAGRDAADRLKIAVSVRKLRSFGGRDAEVGAHLYRQSICAAITALVRDRGAEVTFLSTCQGIPEYWTDDAAVATEFAADLPADVATHVHVDQGFHTPDQLIERLKGFDGVIPCRLHMAILSICANTPVLPVSYEPKFEETFAELGVPDLVTTVGAIAPDAFVGDALAWADDLDRVNAAIDRGAPGMKASAEAAGPAVKAAYRQWCDTHRRRTRPPRLTRPHGHQTDIGD